jgi:hypothetical protein
MTRWWISWWAADDSPVGWPLSDAWLGLWCSGERDTEPSQSVVAWVVAPTESAAWDVVKAEWPELDPFADARFCREKADSPGDRFGRPSWATGAARDAAWGE